MGKEKIGQRIKEYYENRTRFYLPRRTYTILRIDGKCFKNYTRGLKRPFDDGLIDDMDETAKYLCKNIMGVKFAYVQSDEISLLLTDFDTLTTEAWFDGNIQKMVSVSSSMVTSKFNQLRLLRLVKENGFPKLDEDGKFMCATEYDIEKCKLAEFDSRVFTIPSEEEVINYFIWRMQDCTRNSISSVAQSLYSPKELNGKNQSDMQEMCFQKGINWNDYSPKYKRGRLIVKQEVEVKNVKRNKWFSTEPDIFSQNKDILKNLIK